MPFFAGRRTLSGGACWTSSLFQFGLFQVIAESVSSDDRFQIGFKTIKLPRQARDKHVKETGTKRRRGGEFSCFSAGMLWTILASARRARRWQGLNTPPLPPGSSQVHATKRNAFQLRWVLKRKCNAAICQDRLGTNVVYK